MSIAEPTTDKEWQARYDAETLAQAEAIKNDKPRLEAAQRAAQNMAEDKREEAQAMSKVAGKASGMDNGEKTPPRGAQEGAGGQNRFNIGVNISKRA